MVTRVAAITGSIVLAGALSFAGGMVAPGVQAAGGSGNASQACSQAGNAVFGASIPISHGACVSTIRSHGHSSALYASLCRYAVNSNGGKLPTGLTPNTSLITDSTTSSTISAVLSHVTVPTNGFSSVGQCVSAFNAAKHAVSQGSSTTPTGGSGPTSGTHGHSGQHGNSGNHGHSGSHGKGHP